MRWEGDAGRSGFYGASNFWYNGIPEYNAFGALSVRLSEGSPALMTVCTFHNFSHNREVSIDSHNHSVGKFDCGLLHPLLHSFVPKNWVGLTVVKL